MTTNKKTKVYSLNTRRIYTLTGRWFIAKDTLYLEIKHHWWSSTKFIPEASLYEIIEDV